MPYNSMGPTILWAQIEGRHRTVLGWPLRALGFNYIAKGRSMPIEDQVARPNNLIIGAIRI